MSTKTKAKAKALPPLASDLTTSQKRAIYLMEPCEQCQQVAGWDCRIPSGKVLWPPHTARLAAASAAGRIRW